MNDDRHIRACLKLHLADGVGARTFHRLVEAFGSVEAVAEAPEPPLRRVQGVGPKTAKSIRKIGQKEIDAELAAADKLAARILVCDAPDYPRPLRHLQQGRPPLLYVRGRLTREDALAIGMVGSRRCTHYGMEQAQRFGELLGRAGFTVVSGGARGIDTAAHRGALVAGGRTVAVMGCGLSHTYPRENRALFEQIVAEDRGALISELPMRTAVLAGNFPTRNRIISGLSLGVLVVEASRRSGALITARDAASQNRSLFALPGRVDSPMSQGTNDLIRNHGATLVQDLDDILEELGDVGEAIRPEVEQATAEPPLPPGLNEVERRLVGALKDGSRSLDELVRATDISTAEAAAAMTLLVIKGAVEQRPGNVFARKRGRPSRPEA
ncbi:MAG: DNA-processing protein DprA [Phycisphaerae bacterium]